MAPLEQSLAGRLRATAAGTRLLLAKVLGHLIGVDGLGGVDSLGCGGFAAERRER